MNLTKNLQAWRSAGVALHPGVGSDEVLAAFRALSQEPTPDVVDLYRHVGGMDIPDHNEWRLWPLAELKAENVKRSASGVYFSDYLVGCWRFLLSPIGSTSAVLLDYSDGSHPLPVAASLEEFLSLQLTNPQGVLDPRSLELSP